MPNASLDLFVARQPIFNLGGGVEGYELLYRRGAQSVAADGASTRQMSVDVIIQSLLEIGLERITLGRTAWLNFSRDMLISDFHDLLDKQTVIVELLAMLEALPHLKGRTVLMTGDHVPSLGEGAADRPYLSKPFDMTEVIRLVETIGR